MSGVFGCEPGFLLVDAHNHRKVNTFQEAVITAYQYRNYLALIGFLYCGKLGCAVTSRVYEAFKVHMLSRVWKTDLKKYGQWALVTGCTEGIGKEYARQLAARGLNIVLVSRNQAKLESVKQELGELTAREFEAEVVRIRIGISY